MNVTLIPILIIGYQRSMLHSVINGFGKCFTNKPFSSLSANSTGRDKVLSLFIPLRRDQLSNDSRFFGSRCDV